MGDMTTIPLGGDESKDPSKKKVYGGNNNNNNTGTAGRDGKPRKSRRKQHNNTYGNNGGNMPGLQQVLQNPGLMLMFACFWPLAILALFASSSTGVGSSLEGGGGGAEVSPLVAVTDNLEKLDKFEIRKVLDRVDVMGYGPTHPRVAFVVVSETKEALVESVKSIFDTTDWNRIFVVFAVLDDGTTEDDPDLVASLESVEKESKYTQH